MKKLKLFPKIFIYTLVLLLLITLLASGTIYLLAPMMGENSVLSEGTYVDGMSSAITTAAIPRNTEIAHTILRSIPYTVVICIVVSLLCAYFFSKAITFMCLLFFKSNNKSHQGNFRCNHSHGRFGSPSGV